MDNDKRKVLLLLMVLDANGLGGEIKDFFFNTFHLMNYYLENLTTRICILVDES